MARYTDRELAAIIEQELTQAEGSDFSDDQLAHERELAWDYYLGRERGDVPSLAKPVGRSGVRSMDVHDSVNAVLAQVMPAFSSDCPAQFEPDGPGDEAQALAESLACNKVLMDDNQGYQVLYTAIKDSLLFKNGIVKVWHEEREEEIPELLKGVTDEQLALLEGEGWEIRERDGDDAVVTRRVPKQKVLVEAVEPAALCYQKNWWSLDFDDCRFVAERKQYTRSQLVAMGYPKKIVEDLPAWTTATWSSEYAKNLDKNSGPVHAATRDQDLIQVWECYLRVDMTKGGLDSELWQIIYADGHILDKVPVPFVPYAMGTAFLTPHRAAGESLFEKVRDVQDAKTGLLRAMIDNLNIANHQRLVVGPDVNGEDLSVSGPNRHIRAEDVSQVVPLPVLDTSSNAISGMDYLDRVLSARIGASRDMLRGDAQVLQSSAQIGAGAASSIIEHSELMAEQMARMLGETLVRNTFLLLHRTLRTRFKGQLMMRLSGQWVGIDPSTWRPRTRVNIKAGLSSGERNRKIGSLTATVALQTQLLQAGFGGVLTDVTKLHQALTDLSRAQSLDGEYWIDPSSPQAQQAAQQQAEQAAQQQQAQMMIETLPEQVKVKIAELEAQIDVLKILAESDRKEAEIVADIEIAREAASRAAGAAGAGGAGNGTQG